MQTSQSAISPQSRGPPQPQANPMDPQPFYISQPDPPPQRRTWGQPQPISFAHQGPSGGVEWPQQPPRRAQWGAPQPPPQRPMMFDPYSGAPIDQWGNPVPHHYNGNYHQPSPYGGYGNPQQGPYGGYGNPQQGPYGGQQGPPQDPQGGPSPQSHYGQYGASTSGYTPGSSSTTPRTPFRLHEGGSVTPPNPNNPSQVVNKPHSAPAPSRASTLPRRLSESQNDPVSSTPMSPSGLSSRPSYSRQASRDSVAGSSSPNLPPRRLHTSVPAPEEDEMAPQSVSFIDSSAEDAEDEATSSPAVPSKRLSQLNITSGNAFHYQVLVMLFITLVIFNVT